MGKKNICLRLSAPTVNNVPDISTDTEDVLRGVGLPERMVLPDCC